MRLPLFVVVAQWTLLLILGFLVFVVYRQLGLVMRGRAERPEVGPEVGGMAARFDYLRIRDDTVQAIEPGDGVPKLVAFVDPTCPSCELLVGNLNGAHHAGKLDGIEVVLLVSDPPKFLEISDSFRTTELDIGQLVAESAISDYRAQATPLLVAVDRSGVVRASGPAIEEPDVLNSIRASLSSLAQRIPVRAEPALPPS